VLRVASGSIGIIHVEISQTLIRSFTLQIVEKTAMTEKLIWAVMAGYAPGMSTACIAVIISL
jgi:hypothetical protein